MDQFDLTDWKQLKSMVLAHGGMWTRTAKYLKMQGRGHKYCQPIEYLFLPGSLEGPMPIGFKPWSPISSEIEQRNPEISLHYNDQLYKLYNVSKKHCIYIYRAQYKDGIYMKPHLDVIYIRRCLYLYLKLNLEHQMDFGHPINTLTELNDPQLAYSTIIDMKDGKLDDISSIIYAIAGNAELCVKSVIEPACLNSTDIIPYYLKGFDIKVFYIPGYSAVPGKYLLFIKPHLHGDLKLQISDDFRYDYSDYRSFMKLSVDDYELMESPMGQVNRMYNDSHKKLRNRGTKLLEEPKWIKYTYLHDKSCVYILNQ